jgi:hypothetical protein
MSAAMAAAGHIIDGITVLVVPIERKTPFEIVIPRKFGASRDKVFEFLTTQGVFTANHHEDPTKIELFWKSPHLPDVIAGKIGGEALKGLVIYRASRKTNPFKKVNTLFEEYKSEKMSDIQLMYGPIVLARQTKSGDVRPFYLEDFLSVLRCNIAAAAKGSL